MLSMFCSTSRATENGTKREKKVAEKDNCGKEGEDISRLICSQGRQRQTSRAGAGGRGCPSKRKRLPKRKVQRAKQDENFPPNWFKTKGTKNEKKGKDSI